MKYTQHNPLPIPASGPFQNVSATIDAVFDWQYELRRQKLLDLYEKGKAATWNASDLDWSVDVDLERMMAERQQLGGGNAMNQFLNPPRPLSDGEAAQLNLHMNAFMLSQFLHGEQGALLATAKIVETVPWAEAKFYAANQVADEARHVEVYHRYLTEKLGISYGIHPSLGQLLDDILADARWDLTYLGMQIMVEGLALAAFGLQRIMMAEEPLIVDITGRIMGDESRHVAFGVISLEEIYRDMSESELRQREEFVIEATHLMRERLLMQPVFERLGWDIKVWLPWAIETPFMRGFRQMLFSKIVPNLKRLGLLTPRVRDAFEKIGVLHFESMPDSTQDEGITLPPAIAMFLSQMGAPPPTR